MFENTLNTPLDHPLKVAATSEVKKLFNLLIKVKLQKSDELVKGACKIVSQRTD